MQITPDPTNVNCENLNTLRDQRGFPIYSPLKEECSFSKVEICEKKAFAVVGIEMRTTNQNQKSLFQIPQFWQKFYQERIVGKIPEAVSSDIIYAVYSDYDERGYYSTLLGVEVPIHSIIPEGLDYITVPSQRYAMIRAKGPLPHSIPKAWEHVFDHSFSPTRSFRVDFEVYDARSRRLQGAEVDLYISIL